VKLRFTNNEVTHIIHELKNSNQQSSFPRDFNLPYPLLGKEGKKGR
jgi:hypothetical protein